MAPVSSGHPISEGGRLTNEQASISISISKPKMAGYKPLSPYTDDENALSNNLLCPRYAESDSSSAPPSPASIESFDILDSIAWRRGYTSHNSKDVRSRACGFLRSRWKKNRAHMIAILLLFLLLVAACTTGGILAVRHKRVQTRAACYTRAGGARCEQPTWAKCIATNGLGFCEGIM